MPRGRAQLQPPLVPRALALLTGLLCALGVALSPQRVQAHEPRQQVRLAAALAEHQLRLAAPVADHTPWAEALQRFKKAVEFRSGGRVQVRLYLGGQRGSEAQTLQLCRRGELEAVATSGAAMASAAPQLAALQLWYLAKTPEEFHGLADAVMAPVAREALAAVGLTFGFWLDTGERHVASRDRPIRAPADLRGLRLYARDFAAPVHPWRALGALAVPLAHAAVLPALQSQALDGFDQPLLFAVTAQWHSAIRYWTLTGHAQTPAVVAFQHRWFAELPADLQMLLLEEGRIAQGFSRQRVRELEPTLLGLLRAAGVQVLTLTPAERAAFEKAGLAQRELFRKKAPKSAQRLLDAIEDAQKRTL